MDQLASILERKRHEVERRRARAGVWRGKRTAARERYDERRAAVRARLRRARAAVPRVIAEIKLRSPSAGTIRERTAGEVVRVAREYVDAGAAAVSVLCDGAGFGGTVLDVRRVVRATGAPVLFKEFVVDEVQIEVARAMGASLVLLIVRALEQEALPRLVQACHDSGLEPVVEAADAIELDRALSTPARIIGINARDLRTFRVDGVEATRLVETIPRDRIAVYMSGVSTPEGFSDVAATRADAVLIGEALMRSASPGARLREIAR